MERRVCLDKDKRNVSWYMLMSENASTKLVEIQLIQLPNRPILPLWPAHVEIQPWVIKNSEINVTAYCWFDPPPFMLRAPSTWYWIRVDIDHENWRKMIGCPSPLHAARASDANEVDTWMERRVYLNEDKQIETWCTLRNEKVSTELLEIQLIQFSNRPTLPLWSAQAEV